MVDTRDSFVVVGAMNVSPVLRGQLGWLLDTSRHLMAVSLYYYLFYYCTTILMFTYCPVCCTDS